MTPRAAENLSPWSANWPATSVYRRLSELGLPEEVIPELSENAIKDACFITNPRDAGMEDIIDIFKRHGPSRGCNSYGD